MKIFISNELFEDRIPIYDYSTNIKISKTNKYQLVFNDGTITIKIFKSFYLKNLDTFFVVTNLEYFLDKMRGFQNLQFIYLNNKEEEKKCKNSADNHLLDSNAWNQEAIKKYIKFEKKLGKKSDHEKGIEISFKPKIFDSIRSSMESSSLYKSQMMKCHTIFKILKNGNLSLQDFKDDQESLKTIKSMIFAGIIVKKGGILTLNELIL